MATPICGQLDLDASPSNWISSTPSVTSLITPPHPDTITGWDKGCRIWVKATCKGIEKTPTISTLLWFLSWRSLGAIVVSRTHRLCCVYFCQKSHWHLGTDDSLGNATCDEANDVRSKGRKCSRNYLNFQVKHFCLYPTLPIFIFHLECS